MADRTTKVLLGIISVALCGILLRLLVSPAAVQAQSDGSQVQIAAVQYGPSWWRLFVAKDGRLYQYSLGMDMKFSLLGSVRLDQIGSQTLDFNQADAKPQAPMRSKP